VSKVEDRLSASGLRWATLDSSAPRLVTARAQVPSDVSMQGGGMLSKAARVRWVPLEIASPGSTRSDK